MVLAASSSAIRVETGQGDVLTIQRHRTWTQFKHLQKGFENTRGLRLFYHLQTGQPQLAQHSLIPALAEIDLQVLSACILIGETSRIDAAQRLLAAHPQV